MATSLYAEQESDFAFKGDYVTVAGTLGVTGTATMTGVVTFVAQPKFTAPSGTTAGAVWTSGAPALTAGQLFMKVTAGSTTYRIPLFLDA